MVDSEGQIASLRGAKGVNAKDIFKAENDARATLVDMVNSLSSSVCTSLGKTSPQRPRILSLPMTVWNSTNRDKSPNASPRRLNSLAIRSWKIRLGGTHALEHIAIDSTKKYHWPVMEVLTAYVRENSRLKENEAKQPNSDDAKPLLADELKPPATDIQAILTVIGRRRWTFENEDNQRLNLSKTNLKNAELKGAELAGADLAGADLTHAYFEGVNLAGADLAGAILMRAILTHTNLANAELAYAHLEGASLTRAILTDAKPGCAYLTDADLAYADLTREPHARDPDEGAPGGRGPHARDPDEGAPAGREPHARANLTGANLRGVDLTAPAVMLQRRA